MDPQRIELKTLGLAAAAVLVVEAAAMFISARMAPAMIVLFAARLIDLYLLAVVISAQRRGWSAVGLARNEILPGLKNGLFWSAAFGLAAAGGLAALALAGLDLRGFLPTRLPKDALGLTLFFVTGGLAAPMAEEVFFRGLVYGFSRRWGLGPAMIISTLAFVLAHGAGPAAALTQALGGLVFAAAYEVHGRLTAPITIHVLGNLALFSLGIMFS